MKYQISALVFILITGIVSGQQEDTNSFDTANFINSVIKDKRSYIYLYTDVNAYSLGQIKQLFNKGKFVRRIEDENGKIYQIVSYLINKNSNSYCHN